MSKRAQQEAFNLISRGAYTTRTKEKVVPMALVEQAFKEMAATTAMADQQGTQENNGLQGSMKGMSDGLNKRY